MRLVLGALLCAVAAAAPRSVESQPEQAVPVPAVPAAAASARKVIPTAPLVNTTSGPVVGTTGRWRPGVYAYLGIPFAAPPVGDLRWAAPVKPQRSDKTIEATDFGDTCYQITDALPLPKPGEKTPLSNRTMSFLYNLQGNARDSEDCLTLNIWSKPGGSPNKAVIHWIYGGAFVTGASSGGVYDGSVLADENDVIVVSSNYRIGGFGFANGPGISTNNGLRDQRLALEWVRDNIAAFGGDPKRITLMGQSAGGASVDIHSYAWASDPIVAGIIPMSGNIGIVSGASQDMFNQVAPPKGAPSGYYLFSQSLGCGGQEAGPAATLKCLRALPAKTIVAAQLKTLKYPGGSILLPIGSIPIVDNEIIFADLAERQAKGQFAKVPILIGNTEKETDFIPNISKAGETSSKKRNPMGKLMTLFSFQCGVGNAAEARTTAGLSAWRYLYSGDFPNLNWEKLGGGTWHLSDVPQVFGTANYTTNVANTPEEDAYSKMIRSAFTAFAKDPVNGLSQPPFNWPKYNENTDSLVRLAYKDAEQPIFISPKKADALCGFATCAFTSLMKPGSEKPSITSFIALERDLRLQMQSFREAAPGKRAVPRARFQACEQTFPVGPYKINDM